MTTISYAELLTRFAPETPAVPVFRVVELRTLEAYFPAWTPADMLMERCQRLREQWQSYDLAVMLVTDVPREALFGDWREHMPEEAMPDAP
jgi:hypothetical protein